MANSAPGVSVNVTTASANSSASNPTGQWFVIGNASGPQNIPFSITSLTDFTTYFGKIVNGQLTGRYSVTPGTVLLDSTMLYDSLDVFFREGGQQAFVSLLAPASGAVSATTTLGTNVYTAVSNGTWANAASGTGVNGVILSISNVTVNGNTSYTVNVSYNGNSIANSPALYSETDIKNWLNSLTTAQKLVTVATSGSTTALPSANTTTTVYIGSGTTSTAGTDAATSDSGIAAALAVFTQDLGIGQVSYPGATSSAAYLALANHAQANNRVAVLDAANGNTASTTISAVQTLQGAAVDPSYASIFAPWIIVPGVTNSNPSGASSVTFNRTVPPSALAAGKMALNDLTSDANAPAAGSQGGASRYATAVTQTFSATDRASLNAAGVNAIRLSPTLNQIAIYGFRSCAFDANWVFLNNVRFRMQITFDFDQIAEGFLFSEIDGKGHLFTSFNGALAGRCQFYWLRGSLYGNTANAAFTVNTGPQVNTPATIAAGQLNAQVALKMSPMAEFVNINVTKYLANAVLPQ